MTFGSLSTDVSGPLTLWTWPERRRRGEGMVFRAVPGEKDWPLEIARFRVNAALKAGHNVEIKNQAGEIVFSAHRGHVKCPADVDAQESELAKTRRALQRACAQADALQGMLNSREPKYVPIRAANGRTQVWIQRLKQWVPVLDGDGEATTKDIHDAIRKWELEGKHA